LKKKKKELGGAKKKGSAVPFVNLLRRDGGGLGTRVKRGVPAKSVTGSLVLRKCKMWGGETEPLLQ